MSQHEGPTSSDFHHTSDLFTHESFMTFIILHVCLLVNDRGDFSCTEHQLTERDSAYHAPMFVCMPRRPTNPASGAEAVFVSYTLVCCARVYFARIGRYAENHSIAIVIMLSITTPTSWAERQGNGTYAPSN